jgi:hypothetical protein
MGSLFLGSRGTTLGVDDGVRIVKDTTQSLCNTLRARSMFVSPIQLIVRATSKQLSTLSFLLLVEESQP